MTKTRFRSVVKVHGGKSYLKQFIIGNFPKDYIDMDYLEPYGGAGAVLLNKLPSKTEIYNDIDEGLYQIMVALKTQPDELIKRLYDIEYSEENFNYYRDKKIESNMDKAVCEIVSRRMSRGGLKHDFSWSERKRGGQPGEINAWKTWLEQLPQTAERLKDVQLRNMDGIELIKEWNNPNVLVYADPPYLLSTRNSHSIYVKEMSDQDHEKLAEVLRNCKGKVILSGYYSHAYAKWYKGWRILVKEMPNHSSQKKQKERRLELLFLNF